MKRIIPLILVCFIFSGCSALKIITAPFQISKNTTPQSTEKNKKIIKCRGQLEISETGQITCTDGFYSSDESFEQQDRKLSFRERVAQFISKGAGYMVWGAILACVLTFFGFGWVVSGFFNMVFGVGKVLRQTVAGIQEAKKTNVDIATALSKSQDEDVKKFIADYKQKNNIK